MVAPEIGLSSDLDAAARLNGLPHIKMTTKLYVLIFQFFIDRFSVLVVSTIYSFLDT